MCVLVNLFPANSLVSSVHEICKLTQESLLFGRFSLPIAISMRLTLVYYSFWDIFLAVKKNLRCSNPYPYKKHTTLN